MSVNRDELKRMIDQIPEQDAVEVYDFVGYLIMRRKNETMQQLDIEFLSEDEDVINQVQKSREDRENRRVYSKEQGLEYLRSKVEEFEREQNL